MKCKKTNKDMITNTLFQQMDQIVKVNTHPIKIIILFKQDNLQKSNNNIIKE